MRTRSASEGRGDGRTVVGGASSRRNPYLSVRKNLGRGFDSPDGGSSWVEGGGAGESSTAAVVGG